MIELFSRIGAHDSAGYYRIARGILAAELGNFAAAREDVAAGERDDHGLIPAAPALAAFARATIAASENSDDGDLLNEGARTLCADDPSAIFILDCQRQQWLANHGEDVADAVDDLCQGARAAQRDDWLCAAEALLFEVKPPQDLDGRCRALFQRHARYLTDVGKARLLAVTTAQFAQRRQHEQARAAFDAAQRAIQEASALIPDDATKSIYVERASAPLRAAIEAMPEVPVWLVDEPPPANMRSPLFARAARLAGIACCAAAICAVMITRDRVGAPGPKPSDFWVGFIALSLLVTLICSLVSILRREHAMKPVAVGLLAAFAGMGLLIARAETQRPSASAGAPGRGRGRAGD